MVSPAPYASINNAPADGASACTIRLGNAKRPVGVATMDPNNATGGLALRSGDAVAAASERDRQGGDGNAASSIDSPSRISTQDAAVVRIGWWCRTDRRSTTRAPTCAGPNSVPSVTASA